MKLSALTLASLMLAASAAPLPALAQTDPPVVKQRAPGIPAAPRPDETRPPPVGERVAPLPPVRDDRAQAAPPQPSRDPPMPRPVPSIIAP